MVESQTILEQNVQRHKSEAFFYDATHLENSSVFEQMRARKQLRSLMVELDPYKPVLDLGSGTGYLVKHLRHFGVEAIACDLSPDMLNENPAKTRVLCDATYLPFQGGCFGAIVGYSIFHHFPDPEMAMREVVRVAGERSVLYFDHDPFLPDPIMKRNDFTIIDLVGWLIYLSIHPRQVGRLVLYAFGGRRRHLANIASLSDSESFERVRVVELTRILEDGGFRVEVGYYGGFNRRAYLKAFRRVD